MQHTEITSSQNYIWHYSHTQMHFLARTHQRKKTPHKTTGKPLNRKLSRVQENYEGNEKQIWRVSAKPFNMCSVTNLKEIDTNFTSSRDQHKKTHDMLRVHTSTCLFCKHQYPLWAKLQAWMPIDDSPELLILDGKELPASPAVTNAHHKIHISKASPIGQPIELSLTLFLTHKCIPMQERIRESKLTKRQKKHWIENS